MGRRPPSAVRRSETRCRTHERAAHNVPGVGRGVQAAIIEIEHGQLTLGEVARELRLWERLARGEPAGCGLIECCGTHARGTLAEAIRLLPPRARPVLARLVRRADLVYLRRTWSDPHAEPEEYWWLRRVWWE